MLGEKDVIINNAVNRQWHSKTQSKQKELKLMAGAYHELSKEPTNHVMFESVLKFMNKRLACTQIPARPFGTLNPKTDVRFAKNVSLLKKKKFWILVVIIYLFIGLVYAVVRRRTKLFLSWPAMMILAKRLK